MKLFYLLLAVILMVIAVGAGLVSRLNSAATVSSALAYPQLLESVAVSDSLSAFYADRRGEASFQGDRACGILADPPEKTSDAFFASSEWVIGRIEVHDGIGRQLGNVAAGALWDAYCPDIQRALFLESLTESTSEDVSLLGRWLSTQPVSTYETYDQILCTRDVTAEHSLLEQATTEIAGQVLPLERTDGFAWSALAIQYVVSHCPAGY